MVWFDRKITLMWTLWLGLLTFGTGAALAEPLSADPFEVVYEWRASSVPPPYHWRYRVTLQSDGLSGIVVVPGYPDAYDELPRWRVKFTISSEQIAALRKFIAENKLYSGGAWAIKDDPSSKTRGTRAILPGSTFCSLSLRNKQTGYIIPCNDEEIDSSARSKRDDFVSLIRASVPVHEWSRFQSLREQFMRESMPVTHP